jgi:HK97 gp10 family phage protein
LPATVEGIPEAQAAIQGVVDDVKNLADVHALIAQAGEEAARARAPKGETGALSASISSSSNDREAILSINPYAQPGKFYWVYQEFGTKRLKARRYMAKGISAMRKAAGKGYRKKMGDNYKNRAKKMRARNKAAKG